MTTNKNKRETDTKNAAMLRALIATEAYEGRWTYLGPVAAGLGGKLRVRALATLGWVRIEARIVGQDRLGYDKRRDFVTVTEAGLQAAYALAQRGL